MTNTTKTPHTTVISHVNCTDGMMAAYLYWHHVKYVLKEDLADYEFLFCQYNKPVPVMQGKAVIVVDFSFTPEELEHDNFKDKAILMLDHHDSAAKKHGGYGTYTRSCCGDSSVFSAVFKEERSGAGLMWDYLRDEYRHLSTMPPFAALRLWNLVRRVEDRDLWNFKYEDTRAVYELLNSIPQTFEAYDNLVMNTSEAEYNSLLLSCKARTAMRAELAAGYAALATVRSYKEDKTIAIVNCPSNFASEVGSILSEKHAFAVMFVVSSKDNLVIVSMRSNKKTGEDVSKIAGHYGGGGHVNAAGFSFDCVEYPKTFEALLSGKLFDVVALFTG